MLTNIEKKKKKKKKKNTKIWLIHPKPRFDLLISTGKQKLIWMLGV